MDWMSVVMWCSWTQQCVCHTDILLSQHWISKTRSWKTSLVLLGDSCIWWWYELWRDGASYVSFNDVYILWVSWLSSCDCCLQCDGLVNFGFTADRGLVCLFKFHCTILGRRDANRNMTSIWLWRSWGDILTAPENLFQFENSRIEFQSGRQKQPEENRAHVQLKMDNKSVVDELVVSALHHHFCVYDFSWFMRCGRSADH